MIFFHEANIDIHMSAVSDTILESNLYIILSYVSVMLSKSFIAIDSGKILKVEK